MWMTEKAKEDAETWASTVSNTVTDAEAIEEAVRALMRDYGPDRHTDGSDVIAHFVVTLLSLTTCREGNQPGARGCQD